MERVWGSPCTWREPPENLDSGGAKRVEEILNDATHNVSFQLSTVDTYALQDLFYFYDKT